MSEDKWYIKAKTCKLCIRKAPNFCKWHWPKNKTTKETFYSKEYLDKAIKQAKFEEVEDYQKHLLEHCTCDEHKEQAPTSECKCEPRKPICDSPQHVNPK